MGESEMVQNEYKKQIKSYPIHPSINVYTQYHYESTKEFNTTLKYNIHEHSYKEHPVKT